MVLLIYMVRASKKIDLKRVLANSNFDNTLMRGAIIVRFLSYSAVNINVLCPY